MVSAHEDLMSQSLLRLFGAFEKVAVVTETDGMLRTPHILLAVVLHLHVIFEVVHAFELLLAL